MEILTFDGLLDLSLKTIIGRPDLATTRLATASEILALSGDVGRGRNRGVVTNWRMVAIELAGRPARIILLGTRLGENYGTSLVQVIDGPSRRVRTRSGSIYTLAEAGLGEPPLEHLLHLCHLLHRWGVGQPLEVPQVWY